MLRHDEEPERGELSDEDIQLIEEMISSPYHEHILNLRRQIVGKTVLSSVAGLSGYILYLDDNSWVLSFFDGLKFDWILSKDEPLETDLKLLHKMNIVKATKPLAENLPYANEICDIEKELSNSHGKRIENLSIGERNFSFCFPNGWELDVILFTNVENQISWRVFWEKW